MQHRPVVLDAVLEALGPHPPIERAIDGTLGAGGHTRALLDAGVEQVLGLDVDESALALARENLAPCADHVHIVHASYLDMVEEAARLGWDDGVDAILLDLGLSSMQVDTPERGFAFRHDGPLDMRFDRHANGPTAADIINQRGEAELAELFYKYGEERHGRILARAIIRERPIETTGQLAAIIEAAMPRKSKARSNIHPATRVFQALRIAVNDELGAVERVLPLAIDLLRQGGRLAVISFHSLEDRIVKRAFREASTEIVQPPGMASIEAREPVVKRLSRKPITASEAEAEANPRSRSAKLRTVEKL